MKGTLALWYETRTDANDSGGLFSKAKRPVPPKLRLHVNLWRDLDGGFNFLDVGFLLEDVADLGRFYLYLPAPIRSRSIFDLGGALKDEDTLNAVFNEVGTIEREHDDHFVVRTAHGKTRIVHTLVPASDVSVQPINVLNLPVGTIVAVRSGVCGRISRMGAGGDEQYVRLRIQLSGAAENLFTSLDTGPGLGLSPVRDAFETTEFRLNERRSVPSAIRERATRGRFDLRSVHYFLIRRKDHQLGSQHQNFRKIRYLEKEIWTGYLMVGHRPDWRPPQRGMIIYQWRAKPDTEDALDDFIAYASFRIARSEFSPYIVAALAIGAIGGAILNVSLRVVAHAATLLGISPPAEGFANLLAAGFLCLPVGGLFLLPRIGRRRR